VKRKPKKLKKELKFLKALTDKERVSSAGDAQADTKYTLGNCNSHK